jgi:large subunit ribosomal protein L22
MAKKDEKKVVAAAPEAAKAAPKKAAKADKAAKPAEEKKDEKAAKPAKPAVTQAIAFARDVRVTPRKVRLVIDVVRGKDVKEALALLSRINRAACAPVSKLIKSAAANATNNFGLDGDKLYVADIQAADGIRMKRFTPRAKGSASPVIKRMSNIRVIVKERE